jgi:hypothetical protein
MASDLIRTAHGAAAKGGALTVVETPPLDELRPLDAARTMHKPKGPPHRFASGNTDAAGRGSSLTRINVDPMATVEQRRVHRKAQSLVNQRRRELQAQHGAPVSSAVRVELVAWARATAYAEAYDRAGDGVKAAGLAEKASGHQLKAIAIAEREASARSIDTTPSWMRDK